MSSVSRSLRVLEIVVGATEPPSHSELARALKVPKSTLTQILGILKSAGFVSVDGRRYLPGVRLLALGQRIAAARQMRSAIRPVMDRLAERTGESVLLGVLAGKSVTYIEQSPSPRPVRYVTNLGEPRPLYCTALGRVLLAYTGTSARTLGRLASLTPRTITNPRAIDDILEKVRVDGFAVNVGESVEDVSAVAAPLFAKDRTLLAALSVTGPSGRMTDVRERVWPLLRRAVAEIEKSGALG